MRKLLTSFRALVLFFRSKLGLFQSRISLQKASVKVRGLTGKDTKTLPPPSGKIFKQTNLIHDTNIKAGCLSLPLK